MTTYREGAIRSDISLSPVVWTKDPATWDGPKVAGWLVDASPEGCITHEFGHCVQSALGGNLELPYFGRDKLYTDWMASGDHSELSGYAHTSSQENFAETFTAAMTPDNPYYDSPQAVSMRTMLKDTGVWKGPTG
jgi:hypothetical protein